jgi:hypothetical protein
MNQHKAEDFSDRQAAMQKWRQASASHFQQLQQLLTAANPAAK